MIQRKTETLAAVRGTIVLPGRKDLLPAVLLLLLSISSFSHADDAMMVRVAWGGGSEKAWVGSIAVSRGTITQPRPLGIEADEPGSMWLEGGRLLIRQRSPRTYDGVDILVTAPADARLIVQLTDARDPQAGIPAPGDPQPAPPIEVPLADISSEFRILQLDQHENRLLVRRTPGDALRVHMPSSAMVFSPGEKIRFEVVPHLLPVAADTRVEIRAQLLDAQERQLWSSAQEVRAGSGEAVPLELVLPQEEGVYNIEIIADENAGWQRALRQSLRWKRAIVERRVQLVVISPRPPALQSGREPASVLEIDPASSRWWEKVKLPSLPRLSRGLSGPLGNGMRQTVHHPLGDVSQLKPSAESPDVSWEGYTLAVSPPGKPYLLEVEYPSDVPQTLGLSIVETNAAGTLVPIGLDSGIDVSDEAAAAAAPHWERHRLVFWPRTASPLLLITNQRQRSPAVYGKIRVLGGWERLPRADANVSGTGYPLAGRVPLAGGTRSVPDTSNVPDGPTRLIAAYMDRPLLPENFSAEESLDTWSGRTLQDWRTFYQAGTRLVDYLRYAGYNGLVLTVAADGSAIYPSQVLEATPRYDTGAFFASGQDPMPKDVLEMLLRLMDREHLQLVPAIEFAAPLPGLEAVRRRGGAEAQGLEWVGADGATWCQTYSARRGLAPYYNTLDPRVQEAMLSAVRELVRRYAGHAAFRGLALRLSAYGYAQLPGPDWGMDDATIARFEQDTGVRVPGGDPLLPSPSGRGAGGEGNVLPSPSGRGAGGEGNVLPSPSGRGAGGEGMASPNRFAVRAAFLTSDAQRGLWLQWRAAELHKFYHRIQEVLATARPGMSLYLAGAEMLAGPEIEAELRPALPRRSSLPLAFLHAGIDLRLFRDDAQVVLLRPQRILPAEQLTAQAVDLELAQMSEATSFFRGLPQAGSLFFHPPQEVRLPSFDQKVAMKSSSALLLTQAVPSGVQNRQRFAEGLAGQDAQVLIDGGWMLPLGQEAATQRFAAAFRQLPPLHFSDAEESRSGQPVVFRWAACGGKTYAYAVNTAPFPASVQVRLAASPNCTLDDLGGDGHAGRLKMESDGLSWVVELGPYDLAAVAFSEPDVKLFQPRVSLPGHVAESIAQRIRQLGVRAVALRDPPRSLKVLENPGFQSKPSPSDPVPGWSVVIEGPSRFASGGPGVSITTDTTQGHADPAAGPQGAQSVRLASDGPIACLVSRPFAPPATGRITMSIWLRVADAARQPNLHLAVEGKLVGRDYYRYAVIGQPPGPGQEAKPIDTTWGRYIVQFDDLPLEGFSQMRVRVDLMGAGEVWADDVELFDLAFNESELRALYKLLTLADLNLQNGQVGDCLKLLNGYWPRFLMQNVPVGQAVPALAAKPAPAPPSNDAPDEAQPSSWMDRIKGLLPGRLW
jgi:hypothetical protein